ncbi:hypothetical protein CDL15_Pgr023487 [Punica granatum]|uniref:Uncharacterized protein n=1 Tax=Punica granatum TaxID=22663 RepID=A0A218W8X2_PUNGR|nr:hypothetical protein CDL15_Pgr023487 [Punica granatum]PKI59606.1 hypothetical protein CRG98_020015 [Punica granatum]
MRGRTGPDWTLVDRAATAGLGRRWGWLLGSEIWTKEIWTRLKKRKMEKKEKGGRAARESGLGDGIGARDEPRAREGRENRGVERWEELRARLGVAGVHELGVSGDELRFFFLREFVKYRVFERP